MLRNSWGLGMVVIVLYSQLGESLEARILKTKGAVGDGQSWDWKAPLHTLMEAVPWEIGWLGGSLPAVRARKGNREGSGSCLPDLPAITKSAKPRRQSI